MDRVSRRKSCADKVMSFFLDVVTHDRAGPHTESLYASYRYYATDEELKRVFKSINGLILPVCTYLHMSNVYTTQIN